MLADDCALAYGMLEHHDRPLFRRERRYRCKYTELWLCWIAEMYHTSALTQESMKFHNWHCLDVSSKVCSVSAKCPHRVLDNLLDRKPPDAPKLVLICWMLIQAFGSRRRTLLSAHCSTWNRTRASRSLSMASPDDVRSAYNT